MTSKIDKKGFKMDSIVEILEVNMQHTEIWST